MHYPDIFHDIFLNKINEAAFLKEFNKQHDYILINYNPNDKINPLTYKSLDQDWELDYKSSDDFIKASFLYIDKGIY